jgi:hypothetical protein
VHAWNQSVHGVINAARAAMDKAYRIGTSFAAWDMNVPVRITGIGFFDKRGHGVGGTPNRIELHTVIRFEFDPPGTVAAVTPPPLGYGAQQILREGLRRVSERVWMECERPCATTSAKRVPHGGKAYAWLGGYGAVHTDILSQQLTLASTATRISLSFWISVDTKEHSSRGRSNPPTCST